MNDFKHWYARNQYTFGLIIVLLSTFAEFCIIMLTK